MTCDCEHRWGDHRLERTVGATAASGDRLDPLARREPRKACVMPGCRCPDFHITARI